ncbi:MAG: hypothetical protein K2N22_03715 [Clostridia bacterium]|nr:hypothetical protein [Clostridia bacterium]
MKFKIFLISVLLGISVLFAAGCAAKPDNGGNGGDDGSGAGEITTEYDDKKVVKIETKIDGGYTFDGASYNRTFDFENNTVTDEVAVSDKDALIKILLDRYERGFLNDEYESADEYEEYLQTHYNNPKQVSTIFQNPGNMLLKYLKAKGIFTWKDEYVGNMAVTDLSWYNVIITFDDGTVKTSRFYYDYPDKFKNVECLFSVYLHVGMWCDSF